MKAAKHTGCMGAVLQYSIIDKSMGWKCNHMVKKTKGKDSEINSQRNANLRKEMHPCGIKAQQGGCTPSRRQSTKPWIKTERVSKYPGA